MSRPDFTITADVARELAASAQVCGRPMLRRVHDRHTGGEDVVPIPCGSTRESVCPACARKARIIRMQQCSEGWHLTDEPQRTSSDELDDDQDEDEDQDDDDQGSKRVRSTRRRQDMPELPRMRVDPRTVGQVFTAGSGKQYRPSMFLTATLGSYGAVLANGAPRNPAHYDYRRAALDALHFSKLCGRLWANLRRCAGYNVQYFSAIEAQRRLAPHLHAAARGAIPRAVLRQVVEATYYTLWWPPFDQPVYVDRIPVWTGPEHGYADPDTGEILPTWDEALGRLDNDPDAKPAHVMRFGKQLDLQGVIPEQADQAVRYLTKYLTKAIGETYAEHAGEGYQRHIDRLHTELRWLPCSPRCANWLRYGVQPDHASPALIPGQCRRKVHDRDNLGLGRRVLTSRLWSGKTIAQHKADRAQVVRQTLLSAGMDDLDLDRMAASVTLADGSPRFVWTDVRPDHDTYLKIILNSISERQRWRSQYEQAKTAATATDDAACGVSTVAQPP
jgi:hypothetical protein